MKLVVDNRVRLSLERVDDDLHRKLREAFEYENPTFSNDRPNAEPAILRTWREADGEISFPRGGYRRVRELLAAEGLEVGADDRRVESHDPSIPNHRPPPNYLEGDPLWKHQELAVQAAIAKQNCLVRAGTGSGKTTIGFALIGRLKQRTLVVVSTRNLLDQWVERAEIELGIPQKEIGVLGAGKSKLRPLTLALQQTLARGVKQEWAEYFGFLLYDEVQEAAARSVFAAIDPWPAKYRMGLSADETRKDRKEFLIYDLFGAVAAEAKQADLIAAGVVVDVEIRVIPTSFDAPWYRSVMMRGNFFQRQRAFSKFAEELANDETRAQLAVSLTKSEIEAGRQVFVFTERVEHALVLDRDLVRAGVPSGTMIGGPDYRRAFELTKVKLRKGVPSAGVGTLKAIGKGTDIPKVGIAVVATPLAGNKQLFGQVRGRVCRSSEGKIAGRLYYLWDRAIYGRKALENLSSWYRGQVTVFDGEVWVPAREYIASMKNGDV